MSGRILLFFCVIIGVQSIPFPKLTPCKEEDSACLTKTANIIFKLTVLGVPELNIENLDPMYQDEIKGDLAVIKYKLSNSTIEGSKDCYVINMKLNLRKLKLNMEMNCPLIVMYGHYEGSGRILSIPFTGNGEYRIQTKDYNIQVDNDIKISQRKDGKKYVSLKKYQLSSELKGGSVTDLTNLFNGKQKELAESVLQFLNKNWKPVVKELQGPVFNANVRKLVLNFNKYLKSVPLDQMLLDI